MTVEVSPVGLVASRTDDSVKVTYQVQLITDVFNDNIGAGETVLSSPQIVEKLEELFALVEDTIATELGLAAKEKPLDPSAPTLEQEEPL